MYLKKIKVKNHPILNNLHISFMNDKTKKPYPIVVFVGENGCGKTTLLKEIFNYSNSNYVVEKQIISSSKNKTSFSSIFVRQDSKYSEAMNSLTTKISGGPNPFPMKTKSILDEKTIILDTNKFLKENVIHSLFNDPTILEAYESKQIKNIKCGGEVLSLIDGSKSPIDLTKLSSGQQEILLKIKAIDELSNNVDFVLFDEPETSLHPRWQKIIVNFVKDMIKDDFGNSPQLFIATHSEKVLESLVNQGDVLIIRLSKENNEIKSERINEMDLRLPKVTFAELDYVVFNISSFEYHDQLLNVYGDMIGSDNVSIMDKHIQQIDEWNNDLVKKWKAIVQVKNGVIKNNYKTLPVYIRNYFHHPKDGKEPSYDELTKSIEFLRKIIKKQS